MKMFIIKPLEGVGSIKFGMTKEQVESELKLKLSQVRGNRYKPMNGFFIDFDENEIVKAIELADSPGNFEASYKGNNLHKLKAMEAVKYLSQFDTPIEEDEGESYIFPKLQISLWRTGLDKECFDAVGVAREGYFDDRL